MNTPQPTAAEAQPASPFASPLLPIFLIVVVDILGFTIILPLLPFYAERLGATPTLVGLIQPSTVKPPAVPTLSDALGGTWT